MIIRSIKESKMTLRKVDVWVAAYACDKLAKGNIRIAMVSGSNTPYVYDARDGIDFEDLYPSFTAWVDKVLEFKDDDQEVFMRTYPCLYDAFMQVGAIFGIKIPDYLLEPFGVEVAA